tara:strand:- start:297 stop:518 length:222 start_codon:yes stop_codon:yes gene_type:complete
MSEAKSTSASFIKSIIDKKFTNANTSLSDMMKNKAMTAITDFKTSFKYVPNGCSDKTEPSGTSGTTPENTDGC